MRFRSLSLAAFSDASIPVSNRRLAAHLDRGQGTTDFDGRLNVGWWALRIGLGVGPIITSINKYFNKLADWGMYLSPLATRVVPVSTTTFTHVVGAVEIIAGLMVLGRWTKLGSYIVMFWLLCIRIESFLVCSLLILHGLGESEKSENRS